MIDANQADRLVGAWLLDLVRSGQITADQASTIMIALGGKMLKGAWEELPDVKVKLFSALVHGEGVIVGQRKVPEETTEVTQVLPLLDDIAARPGGDLSGLVFIADALHVHRDNLAKIAGRGGGYLITVPPVPPRRHAVPVKGNQPTLRRGRPVPRQPRRARGFPPSPHHP